MCYYTLNIFRVYSLCILYALHIFHTFQMGTNIWYAINVWSVNSQENYILAATSNVWSVNSQWNYILAATSANHLFLYLSVEALLVEYIINPIVVTLIHSIAKLKYVKINYALDSMKINSYPIDSVKIKTEFTIILEPVSLSSRYLLRTTYFIRTPCKFTFTTNKKHYPIMGKTEFTII